MRSDVIEVLYLMVVVFQTNKQTNKQTSKQTKKAPAFLRSLHRSDIYFFFSFVEVGAGNDDDDDDDDYDLNKEVQKLPGVGGRGNPIKVIGLHEAGFAK